MPRMRWDIRMRLLLTSFAFIIFVCLFRGVLHFPRLVWHILMIERRLRHHSRVGQRSWCGRRAAHSSRRQQGDQRQREHLLAQLLLYLKAALSWGILTSFAIYNSFLLLFASARTLHYLILCQSVSSLGRIFHSFFFLSFCCLWGWHVCFLLAHVFNFSSVERRCITPSSMDTRKLSLSFADCLFSFQTSVVFRGALFVIQGIACAPIGGFVMCGTELYSGMVFYRPAMSFR